MYCESPQLDATPAVAITTAASETSPYSPGSRKRVSRSVPARPRARAPMLVETVQKTPRTARRARPRSGGGSRRSRGPESSCTPGCSSAHRARGPRQISGPLRPCALAVSRRWALGETLRRERHRAAHDDAQIRAGPTPHGDRRLVPRRDRERLELPRGGVVGEAGIEGDADRRGLVEQEGELVERDREAHPARLDVRLLERPVVEEAG